MKKARKLESIASDHIGEKPFDFRKTIISLIKCIIELQEQVNKPVETTNEQPSNLNTVKLGNIHKNTYLGDYSCWNENIRFFIANNCIYKYEGWEMCLSDATKVLG